LTAGTNALTFSRGPGVPAGNGLGWDTLVLEVDEASAPSPAQLAGEVVSVSGPPTARVWTLRVSNGGAGEANDVRLDGFAFTPPGGPAKTPSILGRDPNRFPVPIAASIQPGGAATTQVTVNLGEGAGAPVTAPFSANGGRIRGVIISGG
ncbi:MAG: hypothetical protein J2P45_13245, partial [Candidatus Dormibacteraeota bacterium]|nr:hypothetical protein [Candidatus Dormibacteraeota bacterium]